MAKLLNKVRFWGLGLCLVSLLCASCTPQQRLSRLVDRHPELVRDSMVVLSLQRIVPGFSFDVLLPFGRGRQIPFQDDDLGISGTVTVQDNDSVALHIEKTPETIHIDTGVSVPTIVVQPSEKGKDNRFLLGVVFCAGFLCLLLIFTRR